VGAERVTASWPRSASAFRLRPNLRANGTSQKSTPLEMLWRGSPPTALAQRPALTRPGMLPHCGRISRGGDFWEVPFALRLSPGRVGGEV